MRKEIIFLVVCFSCVTLVLARRGDATNGNRNNLAKQDLHEILEANERLSEVSVGEQHERMMREHQKAIEELQKSAHAATSNGPSIKSHETDSEIVVEVDLGGIPKDQVQVTLHDGVLRVSGGEYQEKFDNSENSRRVSRSGASINQKVTVPRGVTSENMKIIYESDRKMFVIVEKAPKH